MISIPVYHFFDENKKSVTEENFLDYRFSQ